MNPLIKTAYYTATLSLLVRTICGKSTDEVKIPSSKCDNDVMPVDGVLISSKSDQVHSSCTIKLETDLDHFMVNIKHLKLSCGQYLKFYYSTNSNGKPDKTFDCRTQRYEIKDFLFVDQKYLTVRFEKPLDIKPYNFSIIITAYESEFFCESDQVDCMYKERAICVDNDLQCDGIVNCPDGKDETLCTYSVDDESTSSVAIGIVVTIVVLTILTCAGCIFGLIRCCWRQRRRCFQGTVVTQHVMTQQSVQSPATPFVYYPTASQQTAGTVPLPESYQTMPPTPAPPSVGYQQGMTAPPGGYPVTPLTATSQPPIFCPPAPYNPQYDPQGNCVMPPPYSATMASAPPDCASGLASAQPDSTTDVTNAPPDSTPDVTNGPPGSTTDVTNAPPDSTPDVTNAPPVSTPDVTNAPPDSTADVTNAPPDSTPDVTNAPPDSTPDVTNAPPDSTHTAASTPTLHQ